MIIARSQKTSAMVSPWVQRALAVPQGNARAGGSMDFSAAHTASLMRSVLRKRDESRIWEPNIGSVGPATFDRFSEEIVARQLPIAARYLPDQPAETAETTTEGILPLAFESPVSGGQSGGDESWLEQFSSGGFGSISGPDSRPDFVIAQSGPTPTQSDRPSVARMPDGEPRPTTMVPGPSPKPLRRRNVRPISRFEEVTPGAVPANPKPMSSQPASPSTDAEANLPPLQTKRTEPALDGRDSAGPVLEPPASKQTDEVQPLARPSEVGSVSEDSSSPEALPKPTTETPGIQPKLLDPTGSLAQRTAPQPPMPKPELSDVDKPAAKEALSPASPESTPATTGPDEAATSPPEADLPLTKHTVPQTAPSPMIQKSPAEMDTSSVQADKEKTSSDTASPAQTTPAETGPLPPAPTANTPEMPIQRQIQPPVDADPSPKSPPTKSPPGLSPLIPQQGSDLPLVRQSPPAMSQRHQTDTENEPTAPAADSDDRATPTETDPPPPRPSVDAIQGTRLQRQAQPPVGEDPVSGSQATPPKSPVESPAEAPHPKEPSNLKITSGESPVTESIQRTVTPSSQPPDLPVHPPNIPTAKPSSSSEPTSGQPVQRRATDSPTDSLSLPEDPPSIPRPPAPTQNVGQDPADSAAEISASAIQPSEPPTTQPPAITRRPKEPVPTEQVATPSLDFPLPAGPTSPPTPGPFPEARVFRAPTSLTEPPRQPARNIYANSDHPSETSLPMAALPVPAMTVPSQHAISRRSATGLSLATPTLQRLADPEAPPTASGIDTIYRQEADEAEEPASAEEDIVAEAGEEAQQAGPDLDKLARQIYPLIKRMLVVERERQPRRITLKTR